MAIDWTKTYGIEYRLYRVDERTWRESEMVGGFASATIEREQAAKVEGGEFAVSKAVGEAVRTGYYRLAALVLQGGASEQVDLATLHCLTTRGTVNHGSDLLSVTGNSVLFPAHAKRFDGGACVPAGGDAVDFAASTLSSLLKAEVVASGGFSLDSGYVFDPGGRVLDGIRTVLDAGGWCIQIDGRGVVSLLPRPAEPALLLDDAGAGLLMPEVSRDLDLSGVPNRYVAVDGSEVAEAVNDDPASGTSTVSLGFVHDAPRDTSPTRVNGETLSSYCARRLEEESTVRDYRTYVREYQPGVHPCSVVRGSLPSVDLEGDLRVERQSVACGARIMVTERAYGEVVAWRAA